MFNTSIGIDLGTSSVVVYVKGKGIILNEPSVVAYNKEDKKVLAVGHSAHRMLGRNPENIEVIRPLNDGVISSFTYTEAMIEAHISKILRRNIGTPKMMLCVPSGVTDVEQRAVIETARRMNIKEIYLMEEPMAAALGAGLDITKPEGKMIVDIGGGTSDMAVISCGKIISGRSLKIAGDEFDEAVFSYIKRHHNLICGPQTTEHIKRTIGSAEGHPEKLSIVARGICNITGLPKSAIITSDEIYPEFSQLLHNITERIKEVLEECSPQLQADILKNGILLAGGGSQLFGLADYIKKNTGVWTYVAENPLVCVAQGAGRALDFVDKYPDNPEKRVYKKAYIHE